MRDTPASTFGHAFIIGSLVAVAWGCAQSPLSPGPAIPQPRALTVVSGWDRTPIPNAIVHLDGAATVTNSAGEFTIRAGTPNTATIDVDAAGFLPHRTRVHAVPANRVIALWPAANDAEAAAIRAMAYYWNPEAGIDTMWRPRWSAYHLVLLVDGSPRPRAEIATEWAGEYREIEELTNLPLAMTFEPLWGSDDYDEQVIVALDAIDASCRDPSGFCAFVDSSLPYLSRPYRLAANRPDVIRRVLALGLLNWNPLPGLLNKAHPAPELSLVERQTLRMAFLRPNGTIWPDTDPSRLSSEREAHAHLNLPRVAGRVAEEVLAERR